jgi:hypothetical protein
LEQGHGQSHHRLESGIDTIPEFILGTPWDHRVDMWSAGETVKSQVTAQLIVQIFELVTGGRLFLRGSPEGMGAPRFMLRQIINLCGAIPKTMKTGSNVDSLRDNELEPGRVPAPDTRTDC